MAQKKEIFVIHQEGDKTYWHKCGVGFQNRDGSVNLKLDLFPGVQLQLRDPRDNGDAPRAA